LRSRIDTLSNTSSPKALESEESANLGTFDPSAFNTPSMFAFNFSNTMDWMPSDTNVEDMWNLEQGMDESFSSWLLGNSPFEDQDIGNVS